MVCSPGRPSESEPCTVEGCASEEREGRDSCRCALWESTSVLAASGRTRWRKLIVLNLDLYMGLGSAGAYTCAPTVPVRPVLFPFSLRIRLTNFALRSFPRVDLFGVPALAHQAGLPRATHDRGCSIGRGFRRAPSARCSTRFERSNNDTLGLSGGVLAEFL